jgi:hypothetical protein
MAVEVRLFNYLTGGCIRGSNGGKGDCPWNGLILLPLKMHPYFETFSAIC